MNFYEKAAATVLRLITAKGASAEIRRIANSYNEVTGAVTPATKQTGTLRAIVLPISSTPKGVFTEADNKLLEDLITGKLRFMLTAAKGLTFEPQASDVVIFGGETFTVRGSTPLSPAGVPLLYKIALEIAPLTPNSDAVPVA